MQRSGRASLAQQTLEILRTGTYQTPEGRTVDIGRPLAAAVRHTKLYRPNEFPEELAPGSQGEERTEIEVTSETSLEAAHRLILIDPEADLFCLNFASAKNPGGGFLNGSQAQEESLARSSGLFSSLMQKKEMYEHNRGMVSCLYSDYMIYSPRVPVFRADDGELLEQPYLVSFLTAPAVNVGVVRKSEPKGIARIRPTLERRAARLLWVATQHQHHTLILGAWGCGVFANDPAMIADIFANALLEGGPFAQAFRKVVFAVYDSSKEQATLNAFRRRLGI